MGCESTLRAACAGTKCASCVSTAIMVVARVWLTRRLHDGMRKMRENGFWGWRKVKENFKLLAVPVGPGSGSSG
jgi:hypothetical protein